MPDGAPPRAQEKVSFQSGSADLLNAVKRTVPQVEGLRPQTRKNGAAMKRVVVVVLPLSMQGPRAQRPGPCTTPAADSPRGQEAPGQCSAAGGERLSVDRGTGTDPVRDARKITTGTGSRAGPAVRKITTTMGGCTFQILSHVTCVRRRRPCLQSRPQGVHGRGSVHGAQKEGRRLAPPQRPGRAPEAAPSYIRNCCRIPWPPTCLCCCYVVSCSIVLAAPQQPRKAAAEPAGSGTLCLEPRGPAASCTTTGPRC
jgi:hypothetical protein